MINGDNGNNNLTGTNGDDVLPPPGAPEGVLLFGLNGNDEKSIATVDPDGVALAAIQGLNARLEAENAALRAQLDALMQRVEALEKRRPGR